MRDADWHDLFDPFFRESTLGQVQEDVDVPQQPRFPWIARSLLAMLGSYERSVGSTDGAEAARIFAQQVAHCSELAERGELSATDAVRLRTLWIEFVAAGAAYRVYADLRAQQRETSDAGKKSGAARKQKADQHHAELLEKLAHGLNRLLALNDFRRYSLSDIESESGVKAGKITRQEIFDRAERLVKK